MFYSHEVLTDRKHGVATIWLLATLGSKSSLKKVTRKAIMDVNVPIACDTIVDPAAPMALRLQGNLLYGVSRVFSQQCGYVLTDMQSLRDKMRGIALLLKELEVDPDIVTTRPEQLNLQIDPGFSIEDDLAFDLSTFDIDFTSSEPSSLLSPRTLSSSQTSILENEQFLGVPVLRDSSFSRELGDGIDTGNLDIDINNDIHGEGAFSQSASDVVVQEQDVTVEEPVFDVDEEGNVTIRDHDNPDELPGEHDDARTDGHDDFQFDYGDDDAIQTDVPTPLPHRHRNQFVVGSQDSQRLDQQQSQQASAVPSLEDGEQIQQSVEQQQTDRHDQEEVETLTGAAHQRTQKTKTVLVDHITELSNRMLAEWNDSYLAFMEDAHLELASKISMAQARRNAVFWVLDQGIGAVDTNFRHDRDAHPLAVFSGQALLDSLTGAVPKQAQIGSRKRTRSTTEAEEENANAGMKRVRSHSKEANVVREDEENVQAMADYEPNEALEHDEIEPEVAREAQAPMSDHPDSMPWNVYASSKQESRHGSVQPYGSVARVSSSIGGAAAFDYMPSSIGSKRISRLITDSPLEQRRRLLGLSSRQGSVFGSGGSRAQNQPAAGSADDGDDFDLDYSINDADLDERLAANLDNTAEFELYGPAAAVSTQEAANPAWLATTLEQEAYNFLGFLQSTIQGKQENLGDEDEQVDAAVTFQELLPFEDNTAVVAAQGLLHVLSLATKGLISVHQEEDFGNINMKVVSGEGKV